MPVPQPGAVINLILLLFCGGGGWFAASLTKPAAPAGTLVAKHETHGAQDPRAEFAADARRLLGPGTAGAQEFDDLIARYGTGSVDLHLLAAPVMEKWASADPEGARTAGLSRCMDHAPDLMPRAVAAVAVHGPGASPELLAAVPAGLLREPCLAALAAAWGENAREEALDRAVTLTRGERTLFIREWHRARGTTDPHAGEKTANAFADPDDRAAALSGCLLALAAADPEAALRAAANHDDYPLVADAVFRAWVPRNPGAAWNAAAALKDNPRVSVLACALVRAEISRRRLTESLSEIQALLARLFPSVPPADVLAILIPALAAEQLQAAQKYVDFLPKSDEPGSRHQRAGAVVLLFDALSTVDPATAWRLSQSLVQIEGATDTRTTHHWSAAAAKAHASPSERIAAGFPDFTDMTALALHWMQRDAGDALLNFCAPGVPASLQRAAVEIALSADGAAIPRADLLQWAKKQPASIFNTISVVTE